MIPLLYNQAINIKYQNEKQMKILILYSGGLDSFIMYHYAKYHYPFADIKCVYYKHGCQSEKSELANLPQFVEVKTMEWLSDSNTAMSKKTDPFAGNIYIPGRNLAFVTLGACQYLPDEIWLGVLSDENNYGATDKNIYFQQETEKLLNYVLSPFKSNIKLRFPFVENRWNKLTAIQWALEIGIEKSLLIQQISCWHHDGINCGQCKQCFKRELNFKLLGISDVYKIDPIKSDYGKSMIKMYVEKYKSNDYNQDEANVYDLIIKNNLCE